MNAVVPSRWASAYWNRNFYLIETFSGYGMAGRDPAGKQHTLQQDATADDLGAAVLDAMGHSRFLSLDEAKDFFDYKKMQEQYAAWIEDLMKQHGYKTKRALFKDMARCNISLTVGDSQMTISPSHHDRLESWSRVKDDGIEDVVIPSDSTPEVVGQALLLGFSRCT
ncbi:contact-dependent growth inhibition system immunity protein [Xenophilus arseniciresistens]|uniref:Contact-dependent growth inhibition system immunity protein n=1 Tax=Xenophilus arseniciresistens TaxID=1283306 RepID=A0AAE3N8S9_9BURK|nr:contact-dependent growth inhibition system immunity protein [Xenophilus arseniciresistens]MDA7416441.1 contact-dependent growth inhibition system immunity protein [Xenophilus arseniciresistens]